VERDDLGESLLALPYFEVSQASWIKAGDLSSTLLQKGMTLPLSDLVIAVLAIGHQCQVYSLDLHFRRIPGSQLYTPRSN
jgi:predicted nucleic acid-binding protein